MALTLQPALAGAGAQSPELVVFASSNGPPTGGIVFKDAFALTDPSNLSKLPTIDQANMITEPGVAYPLVVSGVARKGATIRLFNADVKGWPEIGIAIAGDDGSGNGRYEIRVTDPQAFARGDRVVVTAQDPGGKAESAGVLKEIVPFIKRDGQYVPDDRNADDRSPYYDDQRVTLRAREDKSGAKLEIRAAMRAVPPESNVWIVTPTGHSDRRAAKDGSFWLDVTGVRFGQNLELHIQDIHGKETVVPIVVPSLKAGLADLAAAAKWDGTAIALDANLAFSKGDAVYIKGPSGDATRLQAGEGGRVSGRIEGLQPYSIVDVGFETHGQPSNELTKMLVLPKENGGAALFLPEDCAPESTLASSLASSRMYSFGPANTFILPPIERLPKFGEVDILRGHQLAFRARADADGRIQQVPLPYLAPGEQLRFITHDAVRRRVGHDVFRFIVPAADEAAARPIVTRAPETSTLASLVERIGTGQIGVVVERGPKTKLSAWLKPDPLASQPISQSSPNQIELKGVWPKGTMPESDGAVRGDAVSLSIGDAETGERTVTFSLTKNGETFSQQVRVPLPVGTPELPAIQGEAPLPDPSAVLSLLRRATTFAAFARSLGASASDAAYDAPMRAARALLYALDQITLRHPDLAPHVRSEALAAVNAIGVELADSTRWVPGSGMTGVVPASAAREFWAAARPQTGLKVWQIGSSDV